MLIRLLKQFFQTILRNKGQVLSISITLLASILVICFAWWYRSRLAVAEAFPTLPAVTAPVSLEGLATTTIATPTANGIARQAQPHTVLPARPRFEIVKYGDARALAKAIDGNTAAFLVEPIQVRGQVGRHGVWHRPKIRS